MSEMSMAEAREEMWLEAHTYSALVVCADCGDVAERLIVTDDGEAYRPCERCDSTVVERDNHNERSTE